MLMPHTPSVKVGKASRWLGLGRDTWRWRRLVWELAWREFRARYAGSILGAAWAIAEPAVQFALYLTVFAVFLGMRLAPGAPVGSFGFYLISGLVPFMALQEMALRAAALAREQANLVRHVNVPLQVLLAGVLLAIVLRHGISIALVLLASALAGSLAWGQLGWLVVGCLILVTAGSGLALLLVPVGAYLPDAVPVVGTGLSVLFFVTPIVYPESQVPAHIQRWLAWNPMSGLLDLFRAALVGLEFQPGRAVGAAVAAAVLAVVGAWVFLSRERALRDVV
jgi:lipopolysaccharide transport system permease protein